MMIDRLSSVRAGYDRWAQVYDHDANPLQALEGPKVQVALGDVRGLNTLDLGCGTGRHSNAADTLSAHSDEMCFLGEFRDSFEP